MPVPDRRRSPVMRKRRAPLREVWAFLSLFLLHATAHVVVTDNGACGLISSRDGAGSAHCYPLTRSLPFLKPRAPPMIEDRLIELSASQRRLCALTADSTLLCAYESVEGSFDPQQRAASASSRGYTFLRLAVSDKFVCAVVAKPGSVSHPPVLCYTLPGDTRGQQHGVVKEFAPAFEESQFSYRAIATGDDFVCAVAVGGVLRCVSLFPDHSGESYVTEPWPLAGLSEDDSVIEVSGRGQLFCALKSDNRLACWVHSESEQWRLDRMQARRLFDGEFRTVSVGTNITCAQRLGSNEVLCDIPIPEYENLASKPALTGLAAGTDFFCTAQKAYPFLVCYGASQVFDSNSTTVAPLASLLSYDGVSVAAGLLCALRANSLVECADLSLRRTVAPPAHVFSMTSMGRPLDPAKLFFGKPAACAVESDTRELICSVYVPGWPIGEKVKKLSMEFSGDAAQGCVVLQTGALRCFSTDPSLKPSPDLFPGSSTAFVSVVTTATGGCAIDQDQVAHCWTLEGKEGLLTELMTLVIGIVSEDYGVAQVQPVTTADGKLLVCLLDG